MAEENWLRELMDKLRERIGEGYEVMEVRKPKKGAGGEIQLGVKKEGERTGIMLALEAGKVRQLKRGSGLDDEANVLAETYRKRRSAMTRELLAGENYGELKDKIIFALETKRGNEEALSHIPWRNCLDMAVVFYLLDWSGGEAHYRIVSDKDLEAWKVSGEDIWNTARRNTPNLCQPSLLTVEEAVEGIKKGFGFPLGEMEKYMGERLGTGSPAFVLTNQYGFYGAAAILYEGLLEQVARVWEDDVLVLPNSIHEVLLAPDRGSGKTISQWQKIVREVNMEESQKGQVLSDSVYLYDRKEGKLKIAKKG